MKIQELRHFIPSDVGKYSFFISIMAMFFALSMGQTECLNASSCSVGDDEVFEGNLEIRSTNPVGTVLKSTTTSNQKILELPNADGRLLSVPSSFFPMASNVFLKTDGTGALTLEALDIKTTDIDGTQGTNGQFLKTDGTANGVSWGDIPEINETTFNASNGTNGQILQVNSTGTLDFADMSGGGGSFNAIASQNLVHGSVGIESNGQVRNITTLQNGTSFLNLSESQVDTSQSNAKQIHSFYNSNIDAQVIFYRDYDSNNDATCDTHTYVDVVEHNGSALTKWGRQCVSNEWSNHTSYSNQSTTNQAWTNTNQNLMVRRYGRENDETIDDYVLLYFGHAYNDGQVWGIPVSVDSTTDTIVVGTEALIHDENTCYNNGSCSSNNTNNNLHILIDSAFASGQDDKMYFWWSQYHGGWSNTNYDLSHKSFTCSNLGQTSASCSPDNNHKRVTATSYLKQYSQANYPEIVWDHTAQTWMAMEMYDSYNWKITQFSLQEGVNNVMSFGTYGSSVTTVYTGGTQYTDNTNSLTFTVNSGAYGCVRGYNQGGAFYDEDADVWIFPCYYLSTYNNYDTYGTAFIIASANTSSATGQATIHDYWSSQYALGIDPSSSGGCSAVPNFECKDRPLNSTFGATYYDTTDHIHYWYTPKHQKTGGCLDSYGGNRCMAVWQFEIDPTTKGVKNSTFKEFTYQNADGTKYYNNPIQNQNFIYKDKSENVLIGGFHFGDESASDKYKLSAQAFVIPDNIATYIGFVNQSGSATNQVTVYSVGAVVDGFTGLTIGSEYYVKDDGSVGTSGTYKIGRAIATDKIYITDTR